MKNTEVLKECRRAAKSVGLTFKRSNMNINNSPAYHFIDRASGIVVLENCTLGSAYNNVCSGYIESYNQKTGQFEGI